jgi:hypothetical protein
MPTFREFYGLPSREEERDQLRRDQAERVMPLIGPLLDAWDGTPNDEKDPDSTLFRVMEKIARAMEGV